MDDSNSSSNNGHETNPHSLPPSTHSPLDTSSFMLGSPCSLDEAMQESGGGGSTSTSSVGTPLPSFQETYSPRYRRDVFNFDDPCHSPVDRSTPVPSSGSYHVATTTVGTGPTSDNVTSVATGATQGASTTTTACTLHSFQIDSPSAGTGSGPHSVMSSTECECISPTGYQQHQFYSGAGSYEPMESVSQHASPVSSSYAICGSRKMPTRSEKV